MSQQEADRLVFLDECGSNIALTPLYARAPKGERARGSVPRNRGKNVTLIASLSLEGIGASMILEGGVDALAFATSIEQILAPSLQPGQIVVMDNLSVHKVTRVQQRISERGRQLLFLPASSPDFSPIEETFSKLKTFLRRAGARTREALQEAIAQGLLTVTAQMPLDGLGTRATFHSKEGRAKTWLFLFTAGEKNRQTCSTIPCGPPEKTAPRRVHIH